MANFVDKAGDDAEAESIKSGTSNKSANVCSALGGAFTNCFEFLSGNSVPPVPKVIIPDPGFEGSFTFTLKKRNFISSDYEAYQGQEAVEEARWLFVNKSGSIFKREARIDIENYIRGGNPEKPKQGQLLFSAGFDDKPRFTQALRQGGMQFASGLPMGFVSDGRMWDNDSHYLSHSSLGLGRSYAATLFLNWTMQTSAVLSTETRGAHPSLQAWGQPIRLNVYACGTAIARYYQDEEPVYKTDDSGESRRVGVRRIWRRNVNEFVDTIQYQVEGANGNSKIGGVPLVWTLPGDAVEERANWDCPLFSVRQGPGGWVSSDPPVVTTNPEADAGLAMLVAHLSLTEFSPGGIKSDFSPTFPYQPYGWRWGVFDAGTYSDQPPSGDAGFVAD